MRKRSLGTLCYYLGKPAQQSANRELFEALAVELGSCCERIILVRIAGVRFAGDQIPNILSVHGICRQGCAGEVSERGGEIDRAAEARKGASMVGW